MNAERLKLKAEQYNIQLSDSIVSSYVEYSRLLIEWGLKTNITAITKPEEVEDKHFIDSLLLASQPEVKGKVADVGSGAGFPGLVLKIFNPSLEVTLIESNNKKISFLDHVCTCLNLDVMLYEDRAENLAKTVLRESYDLVTARAVSGLPILSELCLPLVRLDGWFIPMKGPNTDEYMMAQRSIVALGGKCESQKSFSLPDGSERVLYFIRKENTTKDMYPRSMAKIKKQPL